MTFGGDLQVSLASFPSYYHRIHKSRRHETISLPTTVYQQQILPNISQLLRIQRIRSYVHLLRICLVNNSSSDSSGLTLALELVDNSGLELPSRYFLLEKQVQFTI
jgi:hypothetical protein